MAGRRSALFLSLVLPLTVLLAACGGSDANGHAISTAAPVTGTLLPAISGTKPPSFATFGAVIGTPARDGARIVLEPAVCAAGSTERFLAVQREAAFAIYCPTYLPAGYIVDHIDFWPMTAAPDKLHEVDALSANFVNPATGGKIWLSEGSHANDIFPEWKQYGTPPSEQVPYGDFTITLYHEYTFPDGIRESPALWGSSPEGRQQIVMSQTVPIDAETMRRIAEGMARLGPIGTPPP